MELKNYTNGEITVHWKPNLCIHSGNCVRGLQTVFNTKQSPWINIHAADSQTIIDQINMCPSGALSYSLNDLPESENKINL